MAKVLLVEDDNNLREIYEARLIAEGYEVFSAHDGEEALVVAKDKLPDLIISDIMMPKISGFEMLDILRNTEGLKEVKVIMLTALGQSDDQQRASKLGADRYLVKSQVTLEDIVKVAREMLSPGESNELPSTTTIPNTEQAQPANEISAAAAFEQAATIPTASSPETVAANQASDDKLMEDSVNDLLVNTESKPADTSPEVAPQPEIPAPITETPESTPESPAPVTTDPSSLADTVEEESKEIQSQINEFANAPVSDAPNEEVASTQVEASPEASDTQIITPNVPSPSLDVPDPAPAPENIDSPAGAQAPAPTEVNEGDISAPSHKKVIEPINSPEDKPDINALLAKEEAKDILTQPAEPVISDVTAPPEAAPSEPTMPEVKPETVITPAGDPASQVPSTPATETTGALPGPDDPANIAL